MHDDELQREVSPKLRLDGPIARGSFGTVFRGRQLTVARDDAVKVLRPELAPETEAGRLFRDEIRAIGTIDHRNVVRIFDADESGDGRLYFVMELLDGPTLQQLADRGPLPAARARRLGAQLLDGLAAVHASGHIHADVKPANAIVVTSGRDERVVLIDFGLSRIRLADRPAEAVGGTRTYMAPEQLRAWEVDARSDVFSAALVLVELLSGLHRTRDDVLPSLDGIDDLPLRALLTRALADDPAARPTAADLARALRGGEIDGIVPGQRPPFRELAPLTESERDQFYGRDADTAQLMRRLETNRVVVLTAPSGTGKTSLLRAGLAAALDAHGLHNGYLACDTRSASALAEALAPGAGALADALLARRAAREPLVLLLDQVEVALGAAGDGDAWLGALLAGAEAARLSLVLGVREDFVARLVSASPALADGVPQVRLGPLSPAGAREALVHPFAQHGVTLEEPALDAIIDDLTRAGRQLELGTQAIYPPHLQLVGAYLFAGVAPGQTALGRADYDRLGGLDAIVGGHLERTLGELEAGDREVARALFVELVSGAQTRAVCSEHDLLQAVGGRFGEISVRRVLESLARRRLVTPSTGIDGVASWILVHDTLVQRVVAWLTVQDLDRRRAAEVVRFHVRQSAALPGAPAILSRRQLRDLARFPGLEHELEAEHAARSHAVWTPLLLVQRSRQVHRHRIGLAIGAVIATLGVTGVLVGTWLHERALREQVALLRDLNMGRIDLRIEPFDLRRDPETGAFVRIGAAPAELPALAWSLYEPADPDREAPGAPIADIRIRRGTRADDADAVRELGIEVRGGDAFLVVDGRGRAGERCAPSLVPLKHLPGNDHYVTPRALRVRVPTCAASRLDMIDIPAGAFTAGGPGTPPTHFPAEALPPARVVELPAFAIDRTEITNSAFAVFGELADVHEISATEYPDALRDASGPTLPRGGIDWSDARAYCRFLGKDLPTSLEWQKALRGGSLLGGAPNPLPDRNYPWGIAQAPLATLARLASADIAGDPTIGHANDVRRPTPVGSIAADVSPYGVVDLAGNLQEWTLDPEPGTDQLPLMRRSRITHGGNWYDTSPDALVDYMAIENPRAPTRSDFFMGARCVSHAP